MYGMYTMYHRYVPAKEGTVTVLCTSELSVLAAGQPLVTGPIEMGRSPDSQSSETLAQGMGSVYGPYGGTCTQSDQDFHQLCKPVSSLRNRRSSKPRLASHEDRLIKKKKI